MATGAEGRPLYGIPVAIKDNIDVEGMPTTAACPAFAYKPGKDATAVARLRRAGAIVIGKTNLDQFATGLVGVRSPYGIPAQRASTRQLIPGGSSSGSAVAVAAGLVPLSLGTDTAGSGRVPAGLNNIVGLKPSLGLVSTAGVVPACRSLDCVSIFALTTDDCWTALAAIAGPDAADPYSRARPLGPLGSFPKGVRLGVPIAGQRLFFGDRTAAEAYDGAIARAAALGAQIVEIDIEPFYETARLLYEGPWVAERYIVLKSLLASSPDSIHPVTREIILKGARPSAVDTFAAFYELEELRRDPRRGVPEHRCAAAADGAHGLHGRTGAGRPDPAQQPARHLYQLRQPARSVRACGAGRDARRRHAVRRHAARAGRTRCTARLHRPRIPRRHRTAARRARTAAAAAARRLHPRPRADEIAIAVVGAHLSGMPLNGELKALGARLLEATSTAPDYRLYALAGSKPPKPGLLRVAAGKGSAIAVEIWALRAESFGRFVAAVPSPLSIGTLRLADGRTVKGFLVEADAVAGALDISSFGGWRNYLAQTSVPAA